MLALLVIQVLGMILLEILPIAVLEVLEVMPEQLQHTLGRWVILVMGGLADLQEILETQILEILEM
jgi:hypothetical protein